MTVKPLFLIYPVLFAWPADFGFAADKKKAVEPAQRETVAKPMSEKERRRREEKLRKELEGPYRKWLNEDVAYIITDEERQAWKRLSTDEEREQFIEQFWLRRDPSPDTAENEYKEEHYRRIAYANERFASGIPGWKTDRGRIYITFGPAEWLNGGYTIFGQVISGMDVVLGITLRDPAQFPVYKGDVIETITIEEK